MNSSKYEAIIGLEIHVQTKTESKMFCGCNAKYFQSEPNTHTCPTCLGLPGALPVPNQKAIEHCIKTSLALNCQVEKETKFDRKNYFYPDLPKGFQISQYDQPIGRNGFLEIEVGGKTKKIGITRVHQEEDTGKSIHENGTTYLDYNKSGVPLMEVVTEPDFRTKEEINFFAKRLRQIVKYLDVSDADMEKGQMRFELNMSLRKAGETKLPDYKVEVKNIGSISVLEKVVEFEFERQSELLESSTSPIQETRGLRDMTGETYSQRTKESQADYRYFPEPDIPLITFEQQYLDSIEKQIPELPKEKKTRYINELKLDPNVAEIIVSSVESFTEFESLVSGFNLELLEELSKWYTGDYFALKSNEMVHKDFKATWIGEIVTLLKDKKITRPIAKEILIGCYTKGINPTDQINNHDLGMVDDESELVSIIEKVIKGNPNVVEDITKNPNAKMFLVGQVMREMKGKVDPQTVAKILDEKLS